MADMISPALGSVISRIADGRGFHAYIVSGSDAVGRLSAARLIARADVCSGARPPCGVCENCKKADRDIHPDISVTEPEKDKKEITVDAVRVVRAAASVLPNEAAKSVYIINGADRMNIPAQNAMLKTLEEPPSHAVFVLTAENPEKLLPTVRSRCESVMLPPAGYEEEPSAVEFWTLYKRGDRLELFSGINALDKLSRNELYPVVASLRRLAAGSARRGEITPETLGVVVSALDSAEKYLNANVSAVHIAGLLSAALIG